MRERIFQIVTSKKTRFTLLLVLLWISIITTLVLIREVLLPFLLAIFLAYLLQPLVRRLRQVKIKGRVMQPVLATVVIYVGIFAIIAIIGRVTVPQVFREVVKVGRLTSEFITQARVSAPEWPDKIETFFNRYDIPVHFVWGASEAALEAPESLPEVDAITGQAQPRVRSFAFDVDIKKELNTWVAELTDLVSHAVTLVVVRAQGLASKLVSLIFRTFLVLMMCAFILSDTDRIKRFFFSVVPIKDREDYDTLIARIDKGLSGVVRGQVMICLVNGTLTLIGLLLLGVPLPFLLAGLATLLSLIPIFGSIISTIPIVVIALTKSFSLAVLALVWVIVIHLIEANLLNPKIMGEAAKIHPVVVVLALIAGEHFYGLVGALFAVPITSILLTLFRFVHQRALRLQAESEVEKTALELDQISKGEVAQQPDSDPQAG